MTRPAKSRWYTTTKAARRLGVAPSTIRRLIEAGHIKAIRLGRWWRIPRSERGRVRRFYMSLGNYLTAFTTKEGLAEKHLKNVLREIEEAQK